MSHIHTLSKTSKARPKKVTYSQEEYDQSIFIRMLLDTLERNRATDERCTSPDERKNACSRDMLEPQHNDCQAQVVLD